MSIVYVARGTPKPHRIEILLVPPDQRIILLGSPDDALRVLLHWTGTTMVPCLGDECELCPLPVVRAGYSPSVTLRVGAQGKPVYIPAIAFVTDAALDVLDGGFHGKLILLSRKRNTNRSAMLFKQLSSCDNCLPPPFDIQGQLEALWRTRSRATTLKAPEDLGEHLGEHSLPFKQRA